jgi:hypothetical protein
VVALSRDFRLDGPQGRHILDLLLHFDRLKYDFFPSVDRGQTQKVLALDMRQPHYLPVFIILFLFFMGRIIVKLKFGSKAESQKELHRFLLLFDHYHALPRFSVLCRKVDLLVELDFG